MKNECLFARHRLLITGDWRVSTKLLRLGGYGNGKFHGFTIA